MWLLLFIDEMRKYKSEKYERLLRGGSRSYLIPLLRGRPSQGKIERKYNSIPPSTITTFQFTPLNIKE